MKNLMRCQLCKSFTPHEETGLPEFESRLSSLAKFHHCRPGWTRYASEHWACSSCLDQGRALPGDPGVQDCRGGAPTFFAHWDETKLCVYCGADFIFTAGEKKFWYEERGFFTRSAPRGCPVCRRAVRSRKTSQRKLAERLEDLGSDPDDWSRLSELSELYWAVGSKQKALEYLRRAKNRCPEEQRENLLARIRELESREVEAAPVAKYWGDPNQPDESSGKGWVVGRKRQIEYRNKK